MQIMELKNFNIMGNGLKQIDNLINCYSIVGNAILYQDLDRKYENFYF